MSETLKLNCGECNARIKVPRELLGKRRRCPRCNATIRIEEGLESSSVVDSDAEGLESSWIVDSEAEDGDSGPIMVYEEEPESRQD